MAPWQCEQAPLTDSLWCVGEAVSTWKHTA